MYKYNSDLLEIIIISSILAESINQCSSFLTARKIITIHVYVYTNMSKKSSKYSVHRTII